MNLSWGYVVCAIILITIHGWMVTCIFKIPIEIADYFISHIYINLKQKHTTKFRTIALLNIIELK